MKNMFKTFAVIYFVGSMIISIAAAITYAIAIKNLANIFKDESLNEIETTSNEMEVL